MHGWNEMCTEAGCFVCRARTEIVMACNREMARMEGELRREFG